MLLFHPSYSTTSLHLSNFHRKQSSIQPASPTNIFILENRWKRFDHVLRLPLDSLLQLSMTQYYVPLKDWKGQTKTSLPVVHNKELLEHALLSSRPMADDLKGWQEFTEVILTGAKIRYDERRKQHANQNAAIPPHIPQVHTSTWPNSSSLWLSWCTSTVYPRSVLNPSPRKSWPTRSSTRLLIQ